VRIHGQEDHFERVACRGKVRHAGDASSLL
jgi:hypothetical protein